MVTVDLLHIRLNGSQTAVFSVADGAISDAVGVRVECDARVVVAGTAHRALAPLLFPYGG